MGSLELETYQLVYTLCFAGDVKIADNKKKILFILRTSKTHWKDSKPQMIALSASPRINVNHSSKEKQRKCWSMANCPFAILQDYLNVRGPRWTICEPFFILADHSPVMPAMMRNALRNIITRIGLNGKLYCVHSFRIGCSLDLFHKMHLSVQTIKKLGRWHSNSVYAYLR